MTDAELLEGVKKANNIPLSDTSQDDSLTQWIDEVVSVLVGAGVPREKITVGIVARGVSDLWNYDSGGAKLSEYFWQRAAQLSLGR
jgi:hypothetical protein